MEQHHTKKHMGNSQQRCRNATRRLLVHLLDLLGCRLCRTSGPQIGGIPKWREMDVSENSGFSPKSSILIGFSIIFTIHFGVSLFLETPRFFEKLDSNALAFKWLVVVFPLVWVVQHFVSFGDFLSGSSRVNSRCVPRQNLLCPFVGKKKSMLIRDLTLLRLIDGHVPPRALELLFNLCICVFVCGFRMF